MTRSEYDRLGSLDFFRGERVELVHGMVVAMSPIRPPHANAVSTLQERLTLLLSGRAKVRVQQPFLAQDDSEPEPDLAVVPLGRYVEKHPDRALLIVEVAETSLEYDRKTKAPLYAASGVPEYWIVDIAGRAIEVYTEPTGDRYARMIRVTEGANVCPTAFADVVVAVATLFV
jgi:Uma2 family endonuclease